MTRLTMEQSQQQERAYRHEVQQLVSDVLHRRNTRGFDSGRLTRIANRLRELTEEYPGPTNVVGVKSMRVAYDDLMAGVRNRLGDATKAEPLEKQLTYAVLMSALTPEDERNKFV